MSTAKKRVIVIVSGGLVQNVKAPRGVSVEIRDYDVQDIDPENLPPNVREDKDGHFYETWTHRG